MMLQKLPASGVLGIILLSQRRQTQRREERKKMGLQEPVHVRGKHNERCEREKWISNPLPKKWLTVYPEKYRHVEFVDDLLYVGLYGSIQGLCVKLILSVQCQRIFFYFAWIESEAERIFLTFSRSLNSSEEQARSHLT